MHSVVVVSQFSQLENEEGKGFEFNWIYILWTKWILRKTCERRNESEATADQWNHWNESKQQREKHWMSKYTRKICIQLDYLLRVVNGKFQHSHNYPSEFITIESLHISSSQHCFSGKRGKKHKPTRLSNDRAINATKPL